MDKIQIELMAEAGFEKGAHHWISVGANDKISVREMSSQLTVTLASKEISLYRHTVILDGKPYRILHILHPKH